MKGLLSVLLPGVAAAVIGGCSASVRVYTPPPHHRVVVVEERHVCVAA